MGKRKVKGDVCLTTREYLRVSTERYGEGKSPDQQHADNTVAATSRGWQLHPDSYRDDDRSASRYAKRDREDFKRLIEDLKADRFGAGIRILWESSRGSRRVSEWLLLVELCEERGILIFVTSNCREVGL